VDQVVDQASDAPMSVERIANLADRHGAELAHWPRAEASMARAFLAVSPEARAALARAVRLDRVLAMSQTRFQAHSMSVNLRECILAAAPQCGWRGFLVSLWPFGPVWRPAAALLGLAVTGVFLGSTDAATLVVPASVNAALSEEVRVVTVSAVYALDDSNQWYE